MAIERDQRITQPAARFFEEYERALEVLRAEISFHTGDQAEAHHAALWLLSKLFFLCFLQCRRWPDGNPHFLTRFWHRYRRSGCDKDSFVGVWLDRLLAKTGGTYEFLDLRDRPRIPVTLQDLLEHVPALGSGLFLDGPCSQLDPRAVSDASFEQVLGVLDKFNYTLQDEFAPHQDLAVDPGMVGAAYERLVNLSQVEGQQPHSGVFFTPRVEIDLMCRLSLVDWLANHLGEDHKPLLYEVVFASDANRQERADTALAEQDLTSPLCDLLESVTVVDPACGSGSFLVGMLNVLEDLWARADTRHGSRKASADRKLEIVARNLFGVDVMPLAVEISRMRLWLQLYAAASKDLLQSGSNASLPNLSLRIRCGDSLVPQLEGVELTLGRSRELIPTDWAGRIARWSREKDLFFQNDPRCSYRGVAQILNAERTILFDLVDLRMKAIEQMGQSRGQTRQTGLQQARGAQRVLYSAEVAPFVWDSAFIEVFGQGRKGFDLVIGNPPYLRQELIDDPRRPVGRERSAGVRIYKDQLARTVYSVWPATFGYDWCDARARWRLDARSDLYIYFCFHGLSLLGDRGTLCFVVSSAWLDARYGRDLQEFLLTRGQPKMIIENQALRTFARAEINTVILLSGEAQDTGAHCPERLGHQIRFVSLNLPFDQALDSSLWRAVAAAPSRTRAGPNRIFPVRQVRLVKRGTGPDRGSFASGKWGGKYLRAPEIYWLLLERYPDRLVRLGQVAGVRRGITTGANDFFFLSGQEAAEHGIEPEFLVPAIKHPQQCPRVWLDPERDTSQYLFLCHRDREELDGTGALRYIAHGESMGIDQRPTCQARRRWWDLGARAGALLCCNYLVDEVIRFYVSSRPMFVGDNFQELHTELEPSLLAVACNSTVCQLFANVQGRSSFGGGLLKLQSYEVRDLWIPDPRLLGAELNQMLAPMGLLALESEDRLILDEIVFDKLGLTSSEQDAVREAVTRMVYSRLGKANSLRSSI